MDIQPSLIARQYEASRSATAPGEGQEGGGLGAFANEFLTTLQAGEQTAMNSMAGKADPHALVQALAQTELALETAVTVRDKVVEAYQEILRMPV